YAGKDVKNKAVIWLGDLPPASLDGVPGAGRMIESRPSTALEEMGAAASISLSRSARGRPGFGASDFTTTQRLDLPQPPEVSVSDDVLAFIFSASGLSYEELKAKAGLGEALTPAAVKGVK